jgi:hypothetical protein
VLKAADLRWLCTAALILIGAALLRLPGLWSDLWLDELWSLQRVLEVNSWRDLIFRTRIDNNHHLNSLYLYLVAPQSNPAVFRLFAFVSGLATVAVAWVVGARESRPAAALAALLFATSFLMVFYASEARGYATVAWLTLSALYCIERHAESPRAAWAAAFAVCCAFGMMAHQTFVLFFMGAYVWYDARLQRTHRSLRTATSSTLRLFLPPAAFIAIFYIVALSGQETGGGPPYRQSEVIAQALSAVSGGPLHDFGLWITAAVVAAIFVTAVWSHFRSGDDRWILYAAAGVVIPAIMVVARQDATLSPRYFVVPVTVLLLATSRWFARAMSRRGDVMIGIGALVAAHVAGGMLRAATPTSRGHYSDAVRQIVRSSSGDVITVASVDRYAGHEFRTRLLLDYYGQTVAGPGRIRYVAAAEYPTGGVDWAIFESLGETAPESMSDGRGHSFALCAMYPAGDFSGPTWYLYRRESSEDSDCARAPVPSVARSGSRP